MLTISSVAPRVGKGELKSERLTEDCLARIASLNPTLNAFITVTADDALQQARQADREIAAGRHVGPLHGIPLSLKDLIDQQGVPTTAGSLLRRDHIATEDAVVTRRLRDAGAVFVGKTNLHEFAFGTTSEDSGYGPVHNPHDPSRSPGGSSGGSAAAVAAGMCLGTVGTDTGGSIRSPAAACGVVGLKPSFGEVPTDGVVPVSTSLDHVGPLTRTVQDAGWVCDVLAGRTPAAIVAAPAGALRLIRLSGYFDVLDPYVRTCFETALARLRERGGRITDESLSGAEQAPAVYLNLALPEVASWHLPYLDSRGAQYAAPVHARISQGRSISAIDYLAAKATAANLAVAVDRLLDNCDALVLPTLPIPAPPLGAAEIVIDPATGGTMAVRPAMLKHTQLFNLTGHPAISLPVPVSGLPVGVQLVGRRHDTARLLEVAAGCEAVFQS